MKNFLTCFVLLLTLCVIASAQDGALDPSFTLDTTAIQGATTIVTIAIQPPDSKILCLYKKREDGSEKAYITRFQSNGTADPSFTMRHVAYKTNTIQLQSDGKIITTDSIGAIVRLNVGGEPDTTFKTRTSSKILERVNAEFMKVLKDDRIIATTQSKIYVLTSDGVIVQKESIGIGAVNSILEQTDGKILFSGFNVQLLYPGTHGFVFPELKRYTSELVVDTTFVCNVKETRNDVYGPRPYYGAVKSPHNKILFYGREGYFGTSGQFFKCLDNNGKEDTMFNRWNGTVKGVEDGSLLEILPLADGKSILVGSFKWYNGVSTPGIVRVDSTGTIDYSFDMGTGTDGAINSIAVLPNNQLLVAGDFSTYNGIPKRLMAKLTLNQNSIVNAWRASFTIKPNPAADECTLDNIPSGFSVKIVDNSGKVAAYYPPASQTKELVINTRGFASGVYYVFIEDTAGHVFNNILTVEH